MNHQIMDYQGTPEEDLEITSLLERVFVEEGYTDSSTAQENFTPAKLRKRGQLILARDEAGGILGMVILAEPSSPARQVAENDEAEVHLLAVSPHARREGIGAKLLLSCEQRARSLGFSKIVLSTQPTMEDAQRLYLRLYYRHNPARNWSRSGRQYLVYEKPI